ncbi:carboxypeptidase-like regulatory domain-containing protein [Nonlabens marinus]|uniref:TonB-dependent receptor n=1 Tax=Nonlabens marinus S1-08 TaxID=1454201 RepID=W8VQK6_9FLAO|nr:carboxypeptidase-like regulatory domain-containing protein [Nonlabens marinus]BAO55714.1 TonB-dependent receptor [Nonlabens marinus S1-08]
MLKKPFFLTILLICIGQWAACQNSITGKITDIDDEPILGVTIKNLKTEEKATSDFDGNYSIHAQPTDTLLFKFSGYESRSIEVSDSNVIDVELKVNEDLVVIHSHHNLYKISPHYGINYNTYGFTFQNLYDQIPGGLNATLAYSTDFNRNKNAIIQLQKYIQLNAPIYLSLIGTFEKAAFNGNQYFSYKVKSRITLKNSSAYKLGTLSVIVGHLNYNGDQRTNNIGFGLGYSNYFLGGFEISTDFIYWNQLHEFNSRASYYFRRWKPYVSYKHVGKYEEFQIGIGYTFVL